MSEQWKKIKTEKKSHHPKGDSGTTVETNLECKATAALNAEVQEELNDQDKPIEELLNNGEDT